MRMFILCLALACAGLYMTHASAGDEGTSVVDALKAQLAAHADRIAALEKRIVAIEARPGAGMSDEAFRAAMERVEKARDAEREKQRQEAEAQRTRSRLEDLEVELTDEQIKKLIAIQQAHRTKSRETMTKLREAGGGMEAFRTAMETMREDLRTEIETVVPSEHVERIERILGGRGGFRMGGGRGRGR